MRRVVGIGLAVLSCAVASFAQEPVTYRVSFPEAQHHRMQVEVTFADVPPGTLEILMSRTSPGRYAIHEFAKNVFDVRIDDGSGAPVRYERPNPGQWNVTGHNSVVRVRYKVFGDQVDGTFLGVDTTHAHINIPAALMWARGFERRPVRVTFDPPGPWRIATQLHATDDANTFTAANLQYLIDSPVELSNFTLRTFRVGAEFRVALHHTGSDADASLYAAGLERIVREQRAIFGELPEFETPYTFISDFLPNAASDGMEHRNSTILTGAASLRDADQRLGMLSTAAHEFFHSWNVERMRPRSLEPFKLDAPNPSGELWFAEGFTSYYEPLTMHRAGLAGLNRFTSSLSETLDTVIRSPARKYRSAEEVSRMAQFVDQASWSDPTNFDNHFLSYYTWGAAIGLALDLTLRARTGHHVTLDHYMRKLWQEYGRVKPEVEGSVPRPYTIRDLRDVLADVAGDQSFASEFFDRYVHGRDVADYRSLLVHAGLVLRHRRPGHGWIGKVALDFTGGAARIAAPVMEDTPAYAAGLDRGDELVAVDGTAVRGPATLEDVVRRHRPGDTLTVSIRRAGLLQDLTLRVEEDPRLEVVPVEEIGELSAAARVWRSAWLGSKQ
jgi:predicted metalloprotease with PDZ domain